MHRAFRRFPLPVKLLLIGLIPLVFLVYMSIQIYTEKTQKLNLLRSYVERIRLSSSINTLIDYLQQERKFSFDYAMKKDSPEELMRLRPRTDSVIHQLDQGLMSGFTNYTFLKDLQHVRLLVDSAKLPPAQVMHYYTTAIFRINTLNSMFPGSEVYLQPVYKDLVGQKILSEMITSLGIMRSNIYNVLYTKKYMAETLMGMIGVHDVYKTYETEFILKAPSWAVQSYQKIRTVTSLKLTVDYIDTLFRRFKPDSSYSAESWWQISNDGIEELIYLQQNMWNRVNAGINNVLNKEKTERREMLIFLVLALLFVTGIVVYTIYSIARPLTEMKIAAQKISEGATNLQLRIDSNDVIGSLAQSISKIDTTNKLLADAARDIGKGNFNVRIEPRGKEDILGNALVQMKNNLQQYSKASQEANENFRQLAEKYKTIFYKSPLPKWIYDYNTLQFLDVNEAAVKHYGYTQEEFLKMTIADIRPAEDVGKLVDDVKGINPDTDGRHGHWRHIKKNGETITVEITAHFIDYNDRKARLVVVNDITEKIKAEEKLSASEERFRSIIEQFPYPVISYMPDGTCIAANEAWEIMWQDKRENVKGYNIRKDQQLIASGLSRNVERAFTGKISISEPYLYDPALIGQRGRKRWMVMTLYPLKNPGGELLEVILILQDITERKIAEEVLRSSEEKRRLIMNAALDAIVSIDTKGFITSWNPPAEKIFGWKENEIIGRRLSETIIPGKYRERHEKGLQHYLQTGEGPVLNKLIEITALNKEGAEFPVELSIIPIEQDDEKSFCAFIKDISERKKAEERLKQSHGDMRLLASHLQNIREEERAAMAREVHDELGQQITCLKMDFSWLYKKMNVEDPQMKQKMKETTELLDHTAITIRKIATELRPSILDDFGLIEALQWHSQEFEKKSGIIIQFNSVVPDITIEKNIAVALFRIYQESLTNVARHAAATSVTASIVLKDDQLILTISDNGKGFDVTKSSNKKTLGLLGMKERSLMIGGKYEITSAPGKGTTVLVTVPL
jgi:PAS domain S-box-containing protein